MRDAGPPYGRVRFTDETVIFSPARAVRKDGAACPFCPGNESKTRPEVAAVRERGSANDASWRVRAFPNLHPIVEPPHGAHEVIVDDREHGVVVSAESLLVYRDRFAEYEAQPWVGAVTIYKNMGTLGGASIAHPHAQLVALAETPPRLRRLWANAWAHHRDEHECFWCVAAARDPVYENGSFAVATPAVPRFAGELQIIPKRHQPSFAGLSATEATAFIDAFASVQPELGNDYNVLFFSPVRANGNPALHWHATLAPRRNRPAGFELATGLWVVEDEDSAGRILM